MKRTCSCHSNVKLSTLGTSPSVPSSLCWPRILQILQVYRAVVLGEVHYFVCYCVPQYCSRAEQKHVPSVPDWQMYIPDSGSAIWIQVYLPWLLWSSLWGNRTTTTTAGEERPCLGVLENVIFSFFSVIYVSFYFGSSMTHFFFLKMVGGMCQSHYCSWALQEGSLIFGHCS